MNTEPSLEADCDAAYDDERPVRGLMFFNTLDDVPVRELVTVEVGTPTLAAIDAMNARGVGYLLVVRGGKLAGIFTERDVLKRVVGKIDPATVPVEDVMTPNPETLPRKASIAFALNRMSVEGFRHIPLVDEAGRPTAVVAIRDVLNWLVDLFPERVINLPPSSGGFPRSAEGG